MKRLLLALLLFAGACGGQSADDDAATQTVDIEMRDTAFVPSSIEVTAGERVTLRFRNRGKVTHDAYIGNEAEQKKHEKSMRSDGGGGHDHGSDDAGVTVEPGATKSISRRFSRADDGTLVGCHEPGHYASGMKLVVNVRS